MDHHVDGLPQNVGGVARNFHAPGRIGGAHKFAEVAADLFAGSVSIAPIISMACFSRISLTMDTPMGPTPYWMARIFFFT